MRQLAIILLLVVHCGACVEVVEPDEATYEFRPARGTISLWDRAFKVAGEVVVRDETLYDLRFELGEGYLSLGVQTGNGDMGDAVLWWYDPDSTRILDGRATWDDVGLRMSGEHLDVRVTFE